MKVEKRIPFGFKGDWGKVYKASIGEVKNDEVVGVRYANYDNLDYIKQYTSTSTDIVDSYNVSFTAPEGQRVVQFKAMRFVYTPQRYYKIYWTTQAGSSVEVYSYNTNTGFYTYSNLYWPITILQNVTEEPIKSWLLNNTHTIPLQDEVIFEETTYTDIGSDVQFKYVDGIDKTEINAQPVNNLIATGNFRFIETSDAYFDDTTKRYKCVVGVKDIIKAFGSYWVCEKIDERSVFTPQKQTIYRISCKEIFDIKE